MFVGDKVQKVGGTYAHPHYRNGIVLDRAVSEKGVVLLLVEFSASGFTSKIWMTEGVLAPGWVE